MIIQGREQTHLTFAEKHRASHVSAVQHLLPHSKKCLYIKTPNGAITFGINTCSPWTIAQKDHLSKDTARSTSLHNLLACCQPQQGRDIQVGAISQNASSAPPFSTSTCKTPEIDINRLPGKRRIPAVKIQKPCRNRETNMKVHSEYIHNGTYEHYIFMNGNDISNYFSSLPHPSLQISNPSLL